MGEVYRARDTRLNRDVAIKRMAPRLREDPAGAPVPARSVGARAGSTIRTWPLSTT